MSRIETDGACEHIVRMATPRTTSGNTKRQPRLKAGEFLYHGVVISSGSSTKDKKLVRDMRESLERVTRDRQPARG